MEGPTRSTDPVDGTGTTTPTTQGAAAALAIAKSLTADAHDADAPAAAVALLVKGAELAKHYALMAQTQTERAVKNTVGLFTALGGLGAGAGFLAPYALAHGVHRWGGIGIGITMALYVAAFVRAVLIIRSRMVRKPTGTEGGWLALLAIEPADRPRFVLARAADEIDSYTTEAVDVGKIAHSKHRGNIFLGAVIVSVLIVGLLTLSALYTRI